MAIIFKTNYGEIKLNNILAVLPTIRDLDNCTEWANVFEKDNVTLIVIQDGEKQDVNIPNQFKEACREVILLRWADIDNMLKNDNWIISRYDSAIRCFGWLWATKNGLDFDYIFTFDDDTKPLSEDHISQHVKNLNSKVINSTFNTIPQFEENDIFYPRGMLGKRKETFLSHGLWLTVPDFDAKTQIRLKDGYQWDLPKFLQEVPRNILFPMCGMNILFKSELAPIMYFGLMGNNPEKTPWGVGRWDDMFCGWMAKLWIDYIDGAVVSGIPFCDHIRASDPISNLEKEQLWLDHDLSDFILEINHANNKGLINGDKIADYTQSLLRIAKELYSDNNSKKKSIDHFLKNIEACNIFSSYF